MRDIIEDTDECCVTQGMLAGRMLFINGKEMAFETVEMKRNAKCPVCDDLERRRERTRLKSVLFLARLIWLPYIMFS